MTMKIDLKGIHKVKGKLADGTYATYYYAWRGGPRLKGEPGTPEFLRSFDKALDELRKAKQPENRFASIVTKFKTTDEYKRLSGRTRLDYAKILDRIIDKFGTMPLAAFSEDNKAKTRGVMKGWRDKLATKSTRQADYHWVVLARVCSVSLDRGWIKTNPCLAGGRVYGGGDRAELIWSVHDEIAFYEKAPAHLHLAVLLAIWTGQRQGDCLAMVYSKKPIIGVPRFDGVDLFVKQAKGGSFVRVKAIEPLKSALLADYREGEKILMTSRGKAWTTGFGSLFSKVKNDIGLTDLHFHDLRGTAVTRLSLAGCSIQEIGAITGHKNARVNEILEANYMGGTAELAKQAMAKLENYWSQRKATSADKAEAA
jgi:integrase